MANKEDKGLVVTKVGMTRMLASDGKMVPVTLLKVEDQKVTKILTQDRDGYDAVQVGYYLKSKKNLTKADVSRLGKVGIENTYSHFCEFRLKGPSETYQLGAQMDASLFEGVESVDISGVTKGRGYQGAVKRWGSTIGRMTHGSRFHRRPGSLGSNTSPGRVVKNKKQPGQCGVELRTIKNLSVLVVNKEKNIIAVKGSVPGHREGFLKIKPTNKK